MKSALSCYLNSRLVDELCDDSHVVAGSSDLFVQLLPPLRLESGITNRLGNNRKKEYELSVSPAPGEEECCRAISRDESVDSCRASWLLTLGADLLAAIRVSSRILLG